MKDLGSAVRSAQAARDIDASIYGDDHPELVIDELRLAETLAAGDLNAGRSAISRCLGIIRHGAPQGHLRRAEALAVAIDIDVRLGLPPSL